jgi:predicted membrane-bound dolichyl-phosphate-mannose-protein mannosyltransferase
MFLSHAWLLQLPYFWDEAGQFIPTGLDLMKGLWVSESVPPAVHPPGLPAYLALCWKIAGFSPVVTRSAMLLLGSLSLLAAFLLAIELCRDVSGTPAFFAVGLLFVSPLFFAQSVLAQLDAPAMLFTTLALLFFLQDHIRWSAAACAVLVLVKETGVALPLVLMAWLAAERRWRDAAWYLVSVPPLLVWLAVLARRSGTWAGNDGFLW